MAIPFRLIAVALLGATLLLTIVGAATTGWIVLDTGLADYKVNIGLFRMCTTGGGNSICVSTTESLAGSCLSRDQAAQAFIVIGILILVPLFAVVFMRRFMPANPIVGKVPAFVDIPATFVVVFCLTIAWGAIANAKQPCFCEGAPGSCSLHYSFALAIIAWITALAAAVMLFLGRNEGSGYSDVSAPLPN
jgi:hypothetical protein